MSGKVRDCDCCVGTGWQLLLRSMFVTDGYRRERCGVCAGSGKSNHTDKGFRAWQIKARKRADILAGAPEGLSPSDLVRLVEAPL